MILLFMFAAAASPIRPWTDSVLRSPFGTICSEVSAYISRIFSSPI